MSASKIEAFRLIDCVLSKNASIGCACRFSRHLPLHRQHRSLRLETRNRTFEAQVLRIRNLELHHYLPRLRRPSRLQTRTKTATPLTRRRVRRRPSRTHRPRCLMCRLLRQIRVRTKTNDRHPQEKLPCQAVARSQTTLFPPKLTQVSAKTNVAEKSVRRPVKSKESQRSRNASAARSGSAITLKRSRVSNRSDPK